MHISAYQCISDCRYQHLYQHISARISLYYDVRISTVSVQTNAYQTEHISICVSVNIRTYQFVSLCTYQYCISTVSVHINAYQTEHISICISAYQNVSLCASQCTHHISVPYISAAYKCELRCAYQCHIGSHASLAMYQTVSRHIDMNQDGAS